MAEGYKDWAPGDILTAGDLEDYTVKQSVMVFADASARTTALSGVLREGMVSYLKDTDSLELYDGSAWAAVGGAMIKKVEAFTASGTWTVPSDVTYAIAHIRGGGGGANTGSSQAGTGGTSSVAFSGGTISATGGEGTCSQATGGTVKTVAPATNSGDGGQIADSYSIGDPGQFSGQRGAYIVAGDTVTPAASITVTVGAGGTAGAGGQAGASGYVWIEYYEPA